MLNIHYNFYKKDPATHVMAVTWRIHQLYTVQYSTYTYSMWYNTEYHSTFTPEQKYIAATTIQLQLQVKPQLQEHKYCN